VTSVTTRVTVQPDPFKIVEFDRDLLLALAERALVAAGLPDDAPLDIEIVEITPLGQTWIDAVDPIAIRVESGAFEDAKRIRKLSETNVLDVLGRLLFRVRDRRDPGFAAAPADEALSREQRAAWDVYCTGRSGRAGLPVQEQRWRYIFRNRLGFTDAADAAFETLWHGSGLTWDDLQSICVATTAER
jgi:hypothetical protein